MGTKLRHLIASNEPEMVASIEMLPFEVEIKSIYQAGGKIHCWFTVMPNQSTSAVEMLNEKAEKVPTKKTTSRKKKTKKKQSF